MVFVREINKGGKTYRYLYKSKRVNGKVKSIYVGREEVKHSKSVHKEVKVYKKSGPRIIHSKKDDKWMIDRIIEFNKLMEESMDFIIGNKIEAAANHYNKLLNVAVEFHQINWRVALAQAFSNFAKTIAKEKNNLKGYLFPVKIFCVRTPKA